MLSKTYSRLTLINMHQLRNQATCIISSVRLFDHLLPRIHRYDGSIFFHIYDFSLEHLENFNKGLHEAFLMNDNFRMIKMSFFCFQRKINIIKL